MHVLIVEDDAVLGAFVVKLLQMQGHEVALVGDGDSVLARVATDRPELMLLDLGLPRKDGIEVLAEMRHRFPGTSVLVLTGRAEQALAEGRAHCLRLGADDILVKPFSTSELTARCQAILRRRAHAPDMVLRHGDLSMDRVARRVTQGEREVELTSTEFSLLESLLQRGGRCCSREELMREVWPAASVELGAGAVAVSDKATGSNILEVYINYLRRKLGQVVGGRRVETVGRAMVRTVRGEGYRLWVAEVGPQDGSTARVLEGGSGREMAHG
jgi:DNA-binding response OmpR family regulator